jgi:hypothetical protein
VPVETGRGWQRGRPISTNAFSATAEKLTETDFRSFVSTSSLQLAGTRGRVRVLKIRGNIPRTRFPNRFLVPGLCLVCYSSASLQISRFAHFSQSAWNSAVPACIDPKLWECLRITVCKPPVVIAIFFMSQYSHWAVSKFMRIFRVAGHIDSRNG